MDLSCASLKGLMAAHPAPPLIQDTLQSQCGLPPDVSSGHISRRLDLGHSLKVNEQGTNLRRALEFTPSNWVVLVLDWQPGNFEPGPSYPPLPFSSLDDVDGEALALDVSTL